MSFFCFFLFFCQSEDAVEELPSKQLIVRNVTPLGRHLQVADVCPAAPSAHARSAKKVVVYDATNGSGMSQQRFARMLLFNELLHHVRAVAVQQQQQGLNLSQHHSPKIHGYLPGLPARASNSVPLLTYALEFVPGKSLQWLLDTLSTRDAAEGEAELQVQQASGRNFCIQTLRVPEQQHVHYAAVDDASGRMPIWDLHGLGTGAGRGTRESHEEHFNRDEHSFLELGSPATDHIAALLTSLGTDDEAQLVRDIRVEVDQLQSVLAAIEKPKGKRKSKKISKDDAKKIKEVEEAQRLCMEPFQQAAVNAVVEHLRGWWSSPVPTKLLYQQLLPRHRIVQQVVLGVATLHAVGITHGISR